MATIRTFTDLLLHDVTVDTYKGAGPSGDVFAPTTGPVQGFVSEKVRQVRGSDGTVTVSSAAVIVAPGNENVFTPGTRVHLPSGRTTRVLTYLTHDAGNLGAWSHGEVVCE